MRARVVLSSVGWLSGEAPTTKAPPLDCSTWTSMPLPSGTTAPESPGPLAPPAMLWRPGSVNWSVFP